MTPTIDTEIWLPSSSSRQRKTRRQRRQQKPPLFSRVRSVQDKLDLTWFNSCIRILEEYLLEVSEENSGQKKNGRQKKEYNVTCLGLGSPETSDNARAQLAFLLKVCDALNIDCARISIYDPVFTDEDKSLLRQLGMCVLDCGSDTTDTCNITTDEEPTILFMPHCDLALYESVLAANWFSSRLNNSLFICNHLDDYIQNNSIRSLEDKAPHLLNIAPNITSRPLPTSPDWPSAFNNTSVQFLSKHKFDAPATVIEKKKSEEEQE
ncbi:SRR1-domain-containing protein [Lentinula lateritia]|uniref:SRR1-domain-containing protein n=1 Tax=Lentinula lateritia TaxID=40482 RepID=A0ABQ8VK87_9AGAR|nr:SRR1-domain-containing protein [Lentinula lateritia]